MNKPLDIAKKALNMMMQKGADSACATCALSELNELNVDTGAFSLMRTTFDASLSLVLIKNNRRGVVAVNDLSDETMEKAVEECLQAAENSPPDEAWALAEDKQQKTFRRGTTADLEALFHRTQELVQGINQEYPKVVINQLVVSHRQTQSAYVSSADIEYLSDSGLYHLNFSFLGREGEVSSSFSGIGFVTDNLDKPFLEADGMRAALQEAELQIHTVPGKGKYEGSVVFTPGCLQDMLGSALNTFASDSSIIEGTSPWKDKLGQQVADKGLTISSMVSHPDIVAGQNYTGEGYLAEDYDIIKDGVLKQFMLSLYAANKLGLRRAPNSAFALVVAPGDESLESLIAGIDKGLLVGRFSGGQPGPGGEFSGVAKNAFLIEKGKVGKAVSETMISGSLASMLNQVRGISRETLKDGGSVLPWLAVDGITISGN